MLRAHVKCFSHYIRIYVAYETPIMYFPYVKLGWHPKIRPKDNREGLEKKKKKNLNTKTFWKLHKLLIKKSLGCKIAYESFDIYQLLVYKYFKNTKTLGTKVVVRPIWGHCAKAMS